MKKRNKVLKYDWQKYKPESLDKRGITGKSLERLYVNLRKEVYNRQYTLKKAGYGNIPEIQMLPLRTLKSVKQDVPDPEYYMKRRISDFVNFLNNPLTLVRNQGKRAEIKTIKSLQKRGLKLKDKKDLEMFGKYMEMIRNHMAGLIYDSDDAVKAYIENKEKKKKLSIKKLAENFSLWKTREINIAKENIKLLHPKDYEERWRQMGLS